MRGGFCKIVRDYMVLREQQTQNYFIVEGNIGAGKSTFLEVIKKYLNVQVVREPHAKWQQVGGEHNLLDAFYKDMPRWAYTFQTYAFVSRVIEQQEHAKSNPYSIQVLERSVFSDRYCFAKNAYESGNMNALEWKLYQEWFNWLVDGYIPKPAGFIYLQVDPAVCYERLRKRNRSEEETVALAYIQQLHAYHEQWLIRKELVAENLRDIPVLTLTCDRDFEHDRYEQEKHMDQIVAFFAMIGGAVSASDHVNYTLVK